MLYFVASLLVMGFLLLCSISPGKANLGETVEQVMHRYGKPTGFAEASSRTPFGTILFTASGYELVLFILNNKEVGARVSKLDKNAFTDIEMQNIMSSDSNESKWTSVASSDPSCLQWSRSDKATVLYDKDKRMLIFTSDEMVQALHAPKRKAESGKLEITLFMLARAP
jgi:hypothetical protein